jgi:LysR family transcriptional regulator for metE and metH
VRIASPIPIPAARRPVLDVHDLELVCALAAAGSTVRAAARLHLTQSAVSRGLLAAEAKLDTRLFTRGRRGLALTPAGQRLVAGAPAVLGRLIELEAEARTGAGPATLRVVCECYTAYRWLPSTVADLRRAASNLEITLGFEHTGAPADALAAGDIDVALLTTGKVRGRGVIEAPLFDDEIVFLVGRDHPLAARPVVTPAELAASTLIVSTTTPQAERRWFAARVFGAGAGRHGRRRQPSIGTLAFPLTEAIVDAVRAGHGVAPMSEWIASSYCGDPGVVIKRLRGKRLGRPWRIAYRPEIAEAARTFAGVLAAAAPRLR